MTAISQAEKLALLTAGSSWLHQRSRQLFPLLRFPSLGAIWRARFDQHFGPCACRRTAVRRDPVAGYTPKLAAGEPAQPGTGCNKTLKLIAACSAPQQGGSARRLPRASTALSNHRPRPEPSCVLAHRLWGQVVPQSRRPCCPTAQLRGTVSHSDQAGGSCTMLAWRTRLRGSRGFAGGGVM